MYRSKQSARLARLATLSHTFFFAITASIGATAQVTFENPAEGSTVSGISMLSGWACDAETVQIQLANGAVIDAAYGTDRADTEGPCGDTDNGFGVLFNFALLGTGEQTVTLLIDGESVASREFNTIQTSQGEFLTFTDEDLETVNTSTTLNNFPKAGHSVELSWNQALQNFVIVSEAIPASGGADVLQDGIADLQYDAGIFAFDQALSYGACGGGPAPDTECESIAFEVVDDADRGSVLEVSYLSDLFAGIVIDSNEPGLDMSAYETGVLNFDIKVVSAGTNTSFRVKLDDHNGGTTGEFAVDADNSGAWASYSVNMADLLVNVDGNGNGGTMSLTQLKAVVFMATFGQVQDVVFRLDNVYFSE
jgi:hypothetical protein